MALPKIIQKILTNYGYGTDLTGNDNDVVHKTGNETINGEKVFTDSPNIFCSYPKLYMTDSDYERGTGLPSTSSSKFHYCVIDKNNRRVNGIYTTINQTSGSAVALMAYDYTTTGFENCGIDVGFDANGIARASAPSTSTSRDDGRDILTRNWIPKDTRIVHTTGVETISGRKTFTDDIVNESTSPDVSLSNTAFSKGTAPSSNRYWSLPFFDKNGFEVINLVANQYLRLDRNTFDQHLVYSLVDPTSINGSDVSGVEIKRTSSAKAFIPLTDNNMLLGQSSLRWSVVYAGTGSINTSDERLKSYISNPFEYVLDAWGKITFRQFKFNDSIEEKGLEHARMHVGLIAQEIDNVFKSHNLNASDYGLFCHDSWEAIPEEYDEDGNLIENGRPAGDRYSLRYEEALCMEAAYNRRRVSRVEERLLALEQELAELKKNS